MKHTIRPIHFFTVAFKHYGRFVRQYARAQVALLVAYGTAVGVASIWIPVVYKHIIDAVVRGGEVRAELTQLLIILTASIAAHFVLFRIGDYLIITTQNSILKKLADYVLSVLQKKSYRFYVNSFTGGLVAKTRRFIGAFETLHDQLVFQLWMSIITLLGSVSVLLHESLTLGAVFVGWLALYSVLTYIMVSFQLPKGIASAEEDTKVTGRYSDILTNALTVKTFGAEEQEYRTFTEATEEQRRVRGRAWMQNGFWNSLYQAFAVGAFNIGIMWTAVYLWQEGTITAGTIVLVQVYVLTSVNVVWQLSRNIVRSFGALSDAYEMALLLNEEPDVRDPETPEPVRIREGRVTFERVTFGYEGAEPLLRDFDLAIGPGEKVALVGHSGAGKTTIIKLLLRFVDVTGGAVRIDGQDVRAITQYDLHTHIAYVPQEPLLFHRTLRENIRYGRPDADEADVVAAAERAHAHEFISMLPHGYDTLVGERGVKLSGGERQRVAIARALLSHAPIVLLDEATSSLDSISESAIREGFDELMRGRTTIVIAHRLSTIRHMDRIVVLEAGRVVEQGNHDALLAQNGVYARLWNSQVGGFIADDA